MGVTAPLCKTHIVENPHNEQAGQNFLRRPGKNKVLQLGTWNVLSLYRGGYLKKLIDTTKNYNIDILAIQEIRWTGNGILEKKDCTVYYSCHKNLHQFGTGFLIHRNIKHLVIDFQPVNMRICKIRIRGRLYNYSIINIHAPTEEKIDMKRTHSMIT